MTPRRKLTVTAVLFAVGLLLVALAPISESSLPLFLAWIPLVSVGWVLTRPEPSEAVVDPSEDLPDPDRETPPPDAAAPS